MMNNAEELKKENYIPYCRLKELAKLFIKGLIEDGEYEAMVYFDKICNMTDEEKEYLEIATKNEEI